MINRHMHFRDARPPEEILFGLERRLRALFRPAPQEEPRLVFRALARNGTVTYRFRFCLEAALADTNCYSLSIEGSWPAETPGQVEYNLKSSAGWFDYWTGDFQPGAPPEGDEGSPLTPRYRALATRALLCEQHLTDVAAIQQEILDALRAGGRYATSHKEGGTVIRFGYGRFIRSDYGESNASETFTDDARFLAFLSRFFEFETSPRYYPDKPPPYDAWKILLRMLDRNPPKRAAGAWTDH